MLGKQWHMRLRAEALAHCRELVKSDMRSFDSLSIQNGERRASMRRHIMFASIRYRYASDVQDYIAEALVRRMWRIPILLGLVGLLVFRWGKEWFGYQIPLYVLGIIALLAVFFAYSWFMQRYEHGRSGAFATLLTAASLPAASLAITVVQPSFLSIESLEWSFVTGWDAACVLVLTMQATLAIAAIMGRSAMNERCHPLDNLALTTLGLASTIYTSRHRWRSASVTRKWCLEIESVAIHAESALIRPKASPIQSWQLRRNLQEEAWRIGAIFRSHQPALLKASSEIDIKRIVESLTFGVEALLNGDRDSLLVNAPDSVTRISLLKQAMNRVKAGLILIAAGIALPYLPTIPSDAGGSLRVFLIVLGVLQLITTQADVGTRISGVLDKSLPWK